MHKQILIINLLLVSLIWAQTGPKLEITIAEEKVNISAEELRTGQITYSPGDTIRYMLSSKNIGDALMTSPVITDPIPAGVTYVAESGRGKNSIIEYSIDAGKIYSEWPVYYSVRNSKGIILRKQASEDMVTHIRWKIQENIEAGALHKSSFKVVVNP